MSHKGKIAVASGKGGTGKTTVATSLAVTMARKNQTVPPLFLDCDVEAPNAHLYLKPDWLKRKVVSMQIPEIDADQCIHCGLCADTCQFKALALVGEKVLVFPELCHGCGACSLVCPTNAISEKDNPIGVLESGSGLYGIQFARGVLNIGEPMAKPVISELKKWALPEQDQVMILDAPPGTTCSVVETIESADYLLLVTEPTPFGLHDLKLMLELARMMEIPHGVVINRHGIRNDSIEELCEQLGIPVLLTIPFQRKIAEGVSQGKHLVDIIPAFEEKFANLAQTILETIAANKAVVGSTHEGSRYEGGE